MNRIIHSFYQSHTLNVNYVPKNVCFDEFKSVKSAEGYLSFIFCDADTKQIIDMYATYMSLIKKLFPHNKIILDKFHLVQHIFRVFNKTRIRFMNQFKKHVRKFKRYWRLFLKSHTLLNTTTYRVVYCFRQPMREIDILNFLLDLSPELKATYELYQDLLFVLQTKNSEQLNYLLKKEYPLISPELHLLSKTLKRINHIF